MADKDDNFVGSLVSEFTKLSNPKIVCSVNNHILVVPLSAAETDSLEMIPSKFV